MSSIHPANMSILDYHTTLEQVQLVIVPHTDLPNAYPENGKKSSKFTNFVQLLEIFMPEQKSL